MLGASCNYVDNGLDVDPLMMGTMTSLSLPGFVTSYFQPVNGSCILPTSIEGIEKHSEFSVYPNPTSASFNLKFEMPGRMEVYAANGSLIEKNEFTESSHIEIGQYYAAGVYYIKTFSNGTSEVIKLVKQ
jgi:hypothetical protein